MTSPLGLERGAARPARKSRQIWNSEMTEDADAQTIAPRESTGMDFLPLLVAGRAGRKYLGAIWTVRGIAGHVAFGPYCHLPVGQSELAIEVERTSVAQASG